MDSELSFLPEQKIAATAQEESILDGVLNFENSQCETPLISAIKLNQEVAAQIVSTVDALNIGRVLCVHHLVAAAGSKRESQDSAAE